jgi:hypothetical protein
MSRPRLATGHDSCAVAAHFPRLSLSAGLSLIYGEEGSSPHFFTENQEENNMELRLITEPGDREVFATRMSQARAFRNGGFRETEKSCIGKIHLQFGNTYALFDDDSPHPDQMIAGFIVHDQASFALSHSKPDFSQYRPEAVFEIGEMWSLAKGAGICAQYGAVILLGLMQAQAVVGYAIIKPWDLSGFYRDLVPVGEPIEWPYARTLDGGQIFCRAMVSEGEHLQRWIRRVWATGFQTRDQHRLVRFPANVGQEVVEIAVPELRMTTDAKNGAAAG